MTFSVRSVLISALFVVVTIVIWLGAIASRSLLAVELATAATNFLLFLSLPLAVWHPQIEPRKFWTGFCLVGLGSVLLGSYFSAYSTLSVKIASAVAGDASTNSNIPAASGWATSSYIPDGTSSTIIFTTPQRMSGPIPVWPPVAPWQFYQCVLISVPPILSLLSACAGGWLTMWIARPSKTEAAA